MSRGRCGDAGFHVKHLAKPLGYVEFPRGTYRLDDADGCAAIPRE